MFTPFTEVYGNLQKHALASVSVCGSLIVSGGQHQSYLARNYEGFQKDEYIEIADNHVIARQLLKQLAPYGGGNCIYSEDVWLTGFIEQRDGVFWFISVSYCKVRRNDMEITIEL